MTPAVGYTAPNNTQQSSSVYKGDLDAAAAQANAIAGAYAPHAIPPTPAAPTLAYTAGGALAPTTYYVKVTYTTPNGETVASAESSLLVPANNLLTVASPATYGAVAGVTGWNVYVSTSAGTETKQNGSTPLALGTAGTVWTEPTSGLVAGAALPTGLNAMSILVDAGSLFANGAIVSNNQQNSATITAPVSNPRIDRVVINGTTGVISIVTGTPAGSPVAPAITAGSFPCAQILVQTSSTSITNSMITDERTFVPPVVSSAVSGVPIRQTVINGAAAPLAIGTGLAVNLAATATPIEIAFASGFGASGNVDYVGQIAADQTGYWSGLTASIINFLSIDRNAGSGALTATFSKYQPQYGPSYQTGGNALLHLEGTAGSTTFTDDWGNTWAAGGGAPKIQTNQAKFGSAGLGGAGALNILNGTDRIKSTNINTLGPSGASWTVQGWFYMTNYPGTAVGIMGHATSTFMVQVDGGGLQRLSLYINGTNNNTVGTVMTTNAWHHIACTYDGTTYYLYLDGAKVAQIASGTPVGSMAFMEVPGAGNSSTYMTGYVDEFQILIGTNLYPGGTTFTPPSSAGTIAGGDWFDTANMVMKSVSGAGPAFTTVQRVYVGECLAGASTITSVTPYAYNGKYDSAWATPLPGATVKTSITHNLGTSMFDAALELQNIIAEQGYVGGDIIGNPGADSGPIAFRKDYKAMSFGTGGTNALTAQPAAGGAAVALTAADWNYRTRARRSF